MNHTPTNSDVFFYLTSTDWSAISTIATIAAVAVALFLPFYIDHKKKKNLVKLIIAELSNNKELLAKAHSQKVPEMAGKSISKIKLMCPILEHLSLVIWDNSKQTVAEISSAKYLKYKDIASLIEKIKNHSIEISKSQDQSIYSAIIEKEVEKCLEMYNKII